MRGHTGHRPLGREELSLTCPGFLEQALVRPITRCFLHVPQGCMGEGGRKEGERERSSNRKWAAPSSSLPGLADEAGPTGCSPEPELPSI